MDPVPVDESLTPDSAGAAMPHDLMATHATWVDPQRSADGALVAVAADRNYAIVTNCRQDFGPLYAQREVLSRLIVIVPAVRLDEQCAQFRVTPDPAERLKSPINILIRVHPDGTVEVRDWLRPD
jgi:hypothetical protein